MEEAKSYTKTRKIYICRFCDKKVAISYVAQHAIREHGDKIYRVVEFVPQTQIEEFENK